MWNGRSRCRPRWGNCWIPILILRVTISFEPVPLIETLQKQGYRTCLRRDEADIFELFVQASSSG